MSNIRIFPSLIEADLMNLGSVIKDLSPYCDGFHIDVMDNHFVPNLTWGAQFVNAIARSSPHPLHVHCMVDNPLLLIDRLHLRSVDTFIFHAEISVDISAVLVRVESMRWRIGMALSPQTPLSFLKPWFPSLDHVLLMSVTPGFSGQPFLPAILEKLKEMQEWRHQGLFLGEIGMDGGITPSILNLIAQKGCDTAAIGSAIFAQQDSVMALKSLS